MGQRMRSKGCELIVAIIRFLVYEIRIVNSFCSKVAGRAGTSKAANHSESNDRDRGNEGRTGASQWRSREPRERQRQRQRRRRKNCTANSSSMQRRGCSPTTATTMPRSGRSPRRRGCPCRRSIRSFPARPPIYQAICDPLPAILAGLRATTLYFLEQPDFLKLRLHGGFTWGAEPAAAGSRGRTEAWRAALERLRGACQLLTTQNSLDNPKLSRQPKTQ